MSETAAREYGADIKELGDKIVGLSLLKAKELGDYLENVHGIKAAAGGVMMAGPVKADEAKDEKVEQTQFNVVIKAVGDKKIQVIKALRSVTELGLKEAKDMVEKAPCTAIENLDKEAAEKAKKALEESGATVALE